VAATDGNKILVEILGKSIIIWLFSFSWRATGNDYSVVFLLSYVIKIQPALMSAFETYNKNFTFFARMTSKLPTEKHNWCDFFRLDKKLNWLPDCNVNWDQRHCVNDFDWFNNDRKYHAVILKEHVTIKENNQRTLRKISATQSALTKMLFMSASPGGGQRNDRKAWCVTHYRRNKVFIFRFKSN
jgi:hypothetical protein